MTEQELRSLVRSIVADRLRATPTSEPDRQLHDQVPSARPSTTPSTTVLLQVHPSHGRFTLPAEPEGRCVIEPGVSCNHCGFCQSYGH